MMDKILITGATGFIGGRIVTELLKKGNNSLKLFVRDKRKLNPAFQDLELFVGDLRDKSHVEKALEGCSMVIHVAGLVSVYPKDRELLYEINYQASINLFQAALKQKVKKFIYTSTTSCLGGYRSPDMKIKVNASQLNIPYIDSKSKALQSAFHYYKKGLPIVILSPTLTLGEGDVYLSSSELIYSFLKKEIPGYLAGGVNPVYVGDVAAAHINALEYGKNGENYVIAGESNLSLKDFFLTLEKLSEVKAPKIKLPLWIAKAAAFFNELISNKPKITMAAVQLGGLYWYFDCENMKNTLKVAPTNLTTTLNKSISWIKNEYLKNS